MLDSYNDRWALITGASSGIGAEFASQLAGRGMHLILAARRADRMNELAIDLNTRHGTNCHIVAIDLSEPGAADLLMQEIERLLRERGCPKINLQIRSSNAEVIAFYQRIGYVQDDVVSFGRRLIPDDAAPAK